MESNRKDKVARILTIYSKLINGCVVNKGDEANRFRVNERSIQRDIDDIRNYLEQEAYEHGIINDVIYDREQHGHRLDHICKTKFTNDEILAICKILLDSRAFTKNEMQDMINRLIECCVLDDSKKLMNDLISNEMFHYVELKHGKIVLSTMWEIGQAIHQCRYIEIKYQGLQGSTVKTRKLKPLALMFSEYYFYLVAFIDDETIRENFSVMNDSFPTIYRVDRIQSLKILEDRFNIPYKDRFEEGEFRKRIQFMFGGKLRKVKFEYIGYSVEAVLDRLPTAKILSEDNGKYVIQAEVFGDGIDMWLRSQGDRITIIEK
ncbi:helix-turn-helix transcriptional regulator [Filifactor alocis]|uniref:helix-turn-helix transcriptional regulator n=1 Tax=Filifactor alocis TaxID=143361 RepID=UPI0028D90228|nr:WYL domain-containing protein [Filifactor alocis]